MVARHFHLPRHEGTASRQAHCDLPEGSYEREIGRDGFFGPATQMYHRRPPTGWTTWEGLLRPRAFDLAALAAPGAVWAAPTILSNAGIDLRLWRFSGRMDHLVRNGDGDELMFVHEGAGHLFCDYGHLEIRAGDYVLLPRSTMWRIETTAPITALLIEATNGTYRTPDRGLVGRHALYDQGVLDVPTIDEAFRDQQDERTWRVEIKRRGRISTVTYPYNPLDAVGWQGDLCPLRLNMADIRPLVSHRFHLPPSAHTTFVAERFVVCSFVPRPFETDPAAIKVPFFHNNDDYDEVIFYHAGDFFSRDGIHPGMVTFHPCGFTHGPHPGALSRIFEQPKPMTDEYAVMIDTRDALEIGPAVQACERPEYAASWRTSEGPSGDAGER
ncbi:MAG: homogentisate 1,2-dioxygenase [Phyllobacteriaceae bacterium]|nr:homogentisate 1,2-dioxygenase [Phyllobacteriaceae bacterium]